MSTILSHIRTRLRQADETELRRLHRLYAGDEQTRKFIEQLMRQREQQQQRNS
jgi:hypothetical protein